jgi:DsbC/DsbD-like thiol-disulfide interchange protein
MQQRFPLSALSGVCLATLAIAGSVPVNAEGASPWADEAHSRVRLIAGSNTAGQQPWRAGLDILLMPGWKTYWRYPGDSGVPPRFDFSASSNVKTVDVLWPAPERMADGGGQSIGYHDRVIMPLHVVPKDPSQPVQLQLKLSYAVCEKLCVPAEATARLALASEQSANDALLKTAEARVPKPAALRAPGPIAIRAVHREANGPRPRVVVDVAAPQDLAVDLFAEGPTAEWALPLPEPKASAAPGLRQFAFDLDGIPAGAPTKGAEITLTLVSVAGAIEVKTRLD